MVYPTGIITIAFGVKHIDLASNLAKSLIINNSNILRAVVTDNVGKQRLKDYYDIIIPLQTSVNSNLFHKLLLNEYSPFDETLFIDADCLVYKDLNPVFELLSKQSFANVGKEISNGEWYMDVKSVIKSLSLDSIPQINGGIYYFKSDELANKVFAKAIEISNSYTDTGLKPFGDGGINEEPVYSIAMAKNGLSLIDDPDKIIMYTPLGISGEFNIDFIRKRCSFVKHGSKVNPSIIHFCGDLSTKFHYKREIKKMDMLIDKKSKWIINLYIAIRYNIPYTAFVCCKRIIKKLLGRKNVTFFPLMPIYSNN
jgi:hypothetical protein